MLIVFRALNGLIVLIHDDEASVVKTCGSIRLLSPATVEFRLVEDEANKRFSWVDAIFAFNAMSAPNNFAAR